MKVIKIIGAWAMVLSLAACDIEVSGDSEPGGHSAGAASEIVMVDGVKKKRVEGFGGINSESYDESE